jgi:hypothetical protein
VRFFLPALVTALLAALCYVPFGAGCFESKPEVTLGREFPMERIPAITRHVSTKPEIEKLLGPPHRKETLPGNRTKWRYYMRKEQPTRILWIFPSSASIIENRLDIVFDGSIVESIDKESRHFSE